jgi:hypothetical protein
MEVNYVGTAGRKLFRAESVNRVPGARLPEGACVTDTFGRKLCSQVDSNLASSDIEINPVRRLNPNYGRLRVWENSVNSIYHGLQFSVKKRMSHGLQVGGNYTYSHSIDGGSTWHGGATTANGFAASDAFTTDLTRPQLDRGNSIFEIRQRLTFNYVWEMPFMRNRHGIVAGVLGGWQWNGIWSFQTGAHWTPFRGRGGAGSKLEALVPGACSAPTFDPSNCVNIRADYNLDGEANDRPNALANRSMLPALSGQTDSIFRALPGLRGESRPKHLYRSQLLCRRHFNLQDIRVADRLQCSVGPKPSMSSTIQLFNSAELSDLPAEIT